LAALAFGFQSRLPPAAVASDTIDHLVPVIRPSPPYITMSPLAIPPFDVGGVAVPLVVNDQTSPALLMFAIVRPITRQ